MITLAIILLMLIVPVVFAGIFFSTAYLYIIIFLVTAGVTLLAIYIPHWRETARIVKNQKEINAKVESKLKEINFNPQKIFYINDYASASKDLAEYAYKKIIVVNQSQKKICLIDYSSGKMFIVGFEEILNYEVYENGSTVVSGGAAGAFGIVGFDSVSTKTSSQLKLIIRLNRYDVPQVTYDLISGTIFERGVERSSPTYTACLKSLQEVVSFLEIIKNENNKKQKDKEVASLVESIKNGTLKDEN